jgi:hypothetical protein
MRRFTLPLLSPAIDKSQLAGTARQCRKPKKLMWLTNLEFEALGHLLAMPIQGPQIRGS